MSIPWALRTTIRGEQARSLLPIGPQSVNHRWSLRVWGSEDQGRSHLSSIPLLGITRLSFRERLCIPHSVHFPLLLPLAKQLFSFRTARLHHALQFTTQHQPRLR